MVFKDSQEQKMMATFAYHIVATLCTQRDGVEGLKKIFLSSLLTPKDVIAQARRMQLRSGDVKSAIYEDIQYALYVEMRDNQDSRVFDTVYEYAIQLLKNHGILNNYKTAAKRIGNGTDYVYSVSEDANNSIFFFCLWYEGISIGPMLQKSRQMQYSYLVKNKPVDTKDSKLGFLDGCNYGTMPVTESKSYQECRAEVIHALVDCVKRRYSFENVTVDNLAQIIGDKLYFGIHTNVKTGMRYIDELSYLDESIFSSISWVGVDNYHFSHDLLLAVMGDTSIGSYGKCVDYHPNVDVVIELAFQSYLRPYTNNRHGTITRALLRKEITPQIIENIDAFYEKIVALYYVDCIYKVVEQYRDEYYYNFPWFYDFEKQDALSEAPLVAIQPKEQKKDDERYAELNAQYERERKRVNEVCKKHAHELAEKDRAIAEQTSEIEKLQKQIQIQQEYLNLVNAAEEPDVTETLDISSLYGKRFLFVGKLHESNAKLKQTFPTSTFMETDTANIKSLKVDGVVFLIRNMGHSMYYKVMQSNQFAELPKIYCNSRNINNIFQAMLRGTK